LSQEDNLVPNPSFEEYKSLPLSVGDGKGCLAIWDFPNTPGGGEYYHSNSFTKKTNTKKNYFGHQAPHSGDAYAGICVSKECREYLQVKLIRPLTENKEYDIKIHISCADKLYLSSVNEFNIIFSKNSFGIIGNDYLLAPPELKFVQESKYTNSSSWQELSMIYTANGTEQWMTFGSFPYIENEKEYGEIFGLAKYAHYYVDDVSITPLIKETPLVVEHKADIKEQDIKIQKEFVAGETYVLENIQFETGESTLLDVAFPELDGLILYLLKNPKSKLNIVGHTDNVGNSSKNLKLSYDRASVVKQYLTTNRDIKKGLITIDGKGDTEPLNTNTTEADREKNRRVAFSFH
jgi:outer membrane protein OmpA-like peptidoglycan-associated protein